MIHNHFDNLSFSKSNFLEKLSEVGSVRWVEGFGSVNISTSSIEAVSLPDSKKHPPLPSNKTDVSFDSSFEIIFFATVIPSPSAKIPALGTTIKSITTKLVTSPTAKIFGYGVLESLSIGINPGSFAKFES